MLCHHMSKIFINFVSNIAVKSYINAMRKSVTINIPLYEIIHEYTICPEYNNWFNPIIQNIPYVMHMIRAWLRLL